MPTHDLERIAGRITNNAERVIFMVSGGQIELNPEMPIRTFNTILL